MDKRVMRERMRRKKRQMIIRRYTRLATYAVAAILVVVFVIRGIILPIAHRVGGKDTGETVPVQAETVQADPNAAVRQPLKGAGDVGKVTAMTPGWHEDENGSWYQNADGTYFSGGFQKIDGVSYSFDENGYIQTGWVSKGAKDFYFNEDGSYNPEKKRQLLALTFDDGPGQYTDMLLDCLEENNARATFFMQGQNVEYYPEAVKRMAELGCEIGSHTWNHPNLYDLDYEAVAKQFSDTDNALIQACGQPATVARAPFGNWSDDIISAAGKPFFMWSLDSLDWQYKDENLDYDAVMNGDLSDGSIILMHDIHEPSVKAALRIIPDLIAKGYKLVTVSELAEAKNVDLQLASYSDFWQSSLDRGEVAGYRGNDDEMAGSTDSSSDALSDGSETGDGDSSEAGSEDSFSDNGEDYDDGSEDYGDGSEDEYGDGSEG